MSITKRRRGRPPSDNPKPKKIKKEHTYIEKEYKLCKEEQELHIYIDEIDKVWVADVTTPKYINKFIKQGWTTKSIQYYKNGSPKSATFTAPKNAISIRKGLESPVTNNNDSSNKPKRVMTDEQKLALKLGRENKQNKLN